VGTPRRIGSNPSQRAGWVHTCIQVAWGRCGPVGGWPAGHAPHIRKRHIFSASSAELLTQRNRGAGSGAARFFGDLVTCGEPRKTRSWGGYSGEGVKISTEGGIFLKVGTATGGNTAFGSLEEGIGYSVARHTCRSASPRKEGWGGGLLRVFWL